MSTFAPLDEGGRQLPTRVVDLSWRRSTSTASPPPEYVAALWGLDHCVRVAIAADWTAAEIMREVEQLIMSYGAVME